MSKIDEDKIKEMIAQQINRFQSRQGITLCRIEEITLLFEDNFFKNLQSAMHCDDSRINEIKKIIPVFSSIKTDIYQKGIACSNLQGADLDNNDFEDGYEFERDRKCLRYRDGRLLEWAADSFDASRILFNVTLSSKQVEMLGSTMTISDVSLIAQLSQGKLIISLESSKNENAESLKLSSIDIFDPESSKKYWRDTSDFPSDYFFRSYGQTDFVNGISWSRTIKNFICRKAIGADKAKVGMSLSEAINILGSDVQSYHKGDSWVKLYWVDSYEGSAFEDYYIPFIFSKRIRSTKKTFSFDSDEESYLAGIGWDYLANCSSSKGE